MGQTQPCVSQIPREEGAMSPPNRAKGWVYGQGRTEAKASHSTQRTEAVDSLPDFNLRALADTCFLLLDGHVNTQY